MLEKYGFETFVLDIYCFINKDKGVFLCLYVDDIIVAVLTKALIVQTKKKFVKVFEMKELDELYRYLNCWIDCNWKERFIYISQGDFVTKSLEKYGYNGFYPVQTL